MSYIHINLNFGSLVHIQILTVFLWRNLRLSPEIIIILLTFQFNPDESSEADVDGANADADMPEIETPNQTSKTKDR